MKVFDHRNHANNLPDRYAKSESSNNYKLLEVEKHSVEAFSKDVEAVVKALDIDLATSETLNLYGEMLNQPRGVADDTKYRIMLKSKIMSSVSTGNYNETLRAICLALGCDLSEVTITESEKPCTVAISNLPLSVIVGAGLTVGQTTALIQSLIPAGVGLDTVLFEGTFRFSANDWEATATEGFASDDGSVKGGYLGVVMGEENEAVLPIG